MRCEAPARIDQPLTEGELIMPCRTIASSIQSFLALASLTVLAAGCGAPGSSDGKGDGDEDGFAGAPQVSEVLPHVAVSSGYIYVEGKNLASKAGKFDGVTVRIDGKNASDAAVRVDMDIEEGTSTRLTVAVPADMDTRIAGGGLLTVSTPEGDAEFPSPIFAVKDTGFGGAARPGHGLLGTVYALQPSTSKLPDFSGDPCKDPSVVTSKEFSCPHTLILVPNLDVPVHPFTDGFPGLGDNLVEWFAIHFQGYLDVDEPGTYTLETCSDDGSNLYLGSGEKQVQVVMNDGLHGMSCSSGQIELEAGLYPIVIDYYQGPATEIGLQVSWTRPSGTKEIIPAKNFKLFADD
jgi:hypothetical protein